MSAGSAGYQTLTTSIKAFRKLLWQDRGNEGSLKAASRKLTARRHRAPGRASLGPVRLGALEPRSENEIEHDGREHDQPEIAVRPEAAQAILRIVDIERGHLPEEMGAGSGHAKQEHDLGAGQ